MECFVHEPHFVSALQAERYAAERQGASARLRERSLAESSPERNSAAVRWKKDSVPWGLHGFHQSG